MFKRGPIPPLVHGLLDYLFAALLIAAPFLLGFEEDAATALVIVLGVAVLLLGAFTASTTGIVKSIPVVAHAMLDYALAALLIAMPFLLGFSDDGTASAFFVVCGVLGLLLAVATRFTPADAAVASPVTGDPLALHAAAPAELRDRLAAERRGAPFLVYRDGDARQVIVVLGAARARLSLGRSPGNDVALRWDGEVSRVHAELERVGDDWVLSDDAPLAQRDVRERRAAARPAAAGSGDVLTLGGTQLGFVAPADGAVSATATSAGAAAVVVTPAQRRVLVGALPPGRRGRRARFEPRHRRGAGDRRRHREGRHSRACSRRSGSAARAAEPEARGARAARAGARRRAAGRARSVVDPGDGVVALTRHPHVPGARGDRERVQADRERLAGRPAGPCVDHRDGVVRVARDEHAPAGDGQLRRVARRGGRHGRPARRDLDDGVDRLDAAPQRAPAERELGRCRGDADAAGGPVVAGVVAPGPSPGG